MQTDQSTPVSTKTRLLSEARRLFARHGYDGVSMRQIAEAVGVRQSAIYNHFGSKQAILVALMTTHMERVLAALEAAIKDHNTPEARLEAYCRYHVSDHIDYPEDVFLAYMEIRSLESEERGHIIALRNQYEARLRDILAEGQASGSFAKADPAILARALLSMLTGVTVWFRESGPTARDDVVEEYVSAAMRAARN